MASSVSVVNVWSASQSKEQFLPSLHHPRTWRWVISLLVLVYLFQIFTSLRLNTDAITLLSAGQSAAQGHGFLEDGKPTVFPPAYPSLMAMLLRLGWAHPIVIVGLNFAFLGLSVLALRYLLRVAFRFPSIGGLQVIAFTLLSFVLIKHVTIPLTDIAFLSIVTGSLAAMVKASSRKSLRGSVGWTAVAFLTVLLAIATRRNGIALIPAFGWLVFFHPIHRRWFEQVRVLQKAAALGAVLLMLMTFAETAVATSTLRDMEATRGPKLTPAVIAEALGYHVVEVGELALNIPSSKAPAKVGRILVPAVGVVILGLTTAGLMRRRREIGPVDIFCLSYAAILFVWPYYDARFWIAVLPFVMTYVTLSLENRLHGVWKALAVGYKIGFAAAGVLALLYSTTLTFSGARFGERYAGGTMRTSYCVAFSTCASADKNDQKVAALLRSYQ